MNAALNIVHRDLEQAGINPRTLTPYRYAVIIPGEQENRKYTDTDWLASYLARRYDGIVVDRENLYRAPMESYAHNRNQP